MFSMLFDKISYISVMLFISCSFFSGSLLFLCASKNSIMVVSIIFAHLQQFYFQFRLLSTSAEPQAQPCQEAGPLPSFLTDEKKWVISPCSSSLIQMEASSFLRQSGRPELPSLITLFNMMLGFTTLTLLASSFFLARAQSSSSLGNQSSYSCFTSSLEIGQKSRLAFNSFQSNSFSLESSKTALPLAVLLVFIEKPKRLASLKNWSRLILKVWSKSQSISLEL